MRLLAALRRLLGIGLYVANVPRAVRRRATGAGARGMRRNGWHGPYAPPGLTAEEEAALSALEREQRSLRARITDAARWRRGSREAP